jgi:hypothetical protein
MANGKTATSNWYLWPIGQDHELISAEGLILRCGKEGKVISNLPGPVQKELRRFRIMKYGYEI